MKHQNLIVAIVGKARWVKGSAFSKHFAVLVGGTFIAQLIGYGIAPILTRLYSPEEMGELSLFLRITGFLAAVATLRYEMALPLPKKDEHAFLLYRRSFSITVLICGVFLVVAMLLRFIVPEWSATPAMVAVILVSTLFLVAINLGTNWAIRVSDFKRVTRQKLVNSIVSNGLKWSLAWMHWGSWALIVATALGYMFSSLEFLRNYFRLNASFAHAHSPAKTKALLREHSDFPAINLPIVLIDNVRDLLLGGLIFGFYSASVFGSYSHTLSMLSLPIMLVSGSLSQVLFHQLAARKNDKVHMYGLVLKTIGVLVALSIVPFGCLRFYGQEIFTWVFGPEWNDAGRYAEMMTFWLMLNFLFSPLAIVPVVLKKQRFAFLFSTISALIQVGPFVWCYYEKRARPSDFEWALNLSSNVLATWFVVLLIIYVCWARASDNELNHELEGSHS